jgi:hypothetical protein
MNNKTALYYLLSGSIYYKHIGNRDHLKILKKEVDKEIEYFFSKRSIRNEPWNKRYLKMLSVVFSVNLLARRTESRLYSFFSYYTDKYNKFALSTMLALKEFNSNRKYFHIDVDKEKFLPELIYEINDKVNEYCLKCKCKFVRENFIFSNTSIGIELEFSNKGVKAGSFFESGQDDPLLNFSKYHYYHLMKFMWRFGAYVDSNTPFKQFVKKGGFLEYTFTRPDMVFRASQPLTSSPYIAANLIEEAVKFTPVRPHSLHISFELKSNFKLKSISYEDIIFILLCTGHFVLDERGNVKESRVTEKNMKMLAEIRDRRNDNGWVVTVEFTHMRLCREFIKRNVYEPSILFLIACKNIFDFNNVGGYSNELLEWGKSPYIPDINFNEKFNLIKKGLDMEISLPLWYKEKIFDEIMEIFNFNIKTINENLKKRDKVGK